MGYAAGVGKTYKMLEEAQALKAQGVDIVIGYFEPHGRKGYHCQNRRARDTAAGKGSSIAEPYLKKWIPLPFWRDLPRPLRRGRVPAYKRPRLPSAAKRWEDVQVLLTPASMS